VIQMTVLLCALHLYVARRFLLSYLVAATLLLTYESIFLPFIVAPFFLEDPARRLIKRFAIHALIFAAIIAVIFGARALLGEPRALETSSHLSEEIPKIVWSCVANPVLGLWSILTRPVDALMHSRAEGCIVAIIAGLITFFVLRTFRENIASDLSARSKTALLILCAGAIAWVVSYVLDFRPDYYPPGITIGRLSAIHGIAGFGAALMLAAIVSLLSDLLPQTLRTAFEVCSALFVAGLAAFGFHIQEAEYVTSWQQQRDFWLELAPLIQDARPNDNILLQTEFRRHGFIPYTQGFNADEITIYPNLAFSYFLDYTPDPTHPPTFHGYADYVKISQSDGEIVIESPWFDPARFAHIRGDNLLFLKVQDGVAQRVEGEITIGGHTVFARPVASVTGNPVKISRLFWDLFEPSGSTSWFTLRSARRAPPW
jgi:hypothetical protein